jgi:hypothetical protein
MRAGEPEQTWSHRPAFVFFPARRAPIRVRIQTSRTRRNDIEE